MNIDTLSRAGFPHPTLEQLAKINRFTPSQTQPLESNEVVVITYTVADNLINRSSGKWDNFSLETMAQILPGLPFSLDHDWENISKQQGRVFDARLVKIGEDSVNGGMLSKAGNFAQNTEIAASGLYAVEADVYFSADSPILPLIRKGLYSHVSLGGFRYKDLHCPLCETSFYEESCHHAVPYPGQESDEMTAPYHIRVGLIDAGEVSAVLIPNLPGAQIK